MNISQKWRLADLYIPSDWKGALQEFLKEQDLVQSIDRFQELMADFRQFSSYANCLFSENVENPTASKLMAESLEFETELQKAGNILDSRLVEIEDFDAFLQHEKLAPIAFLLKLRRETIQQKMSLEKEALVSDLALSGYHSWNELYKKTTSVLNLNEAEKLLSNPNREVRERAFVALESSCKQHENTFCEALRSIFGFRLQLYKNRGWKNPLHDALRNNYMEQRTLDVMWNNVKNASPIFHRFLDEKAKFFGIERLCWYDFEAPFPGVKSTFPYKDACRTLVELFSAAHPEMGKFAENCIANGWVEAEDRPLKAPGGFCTPFPRAKESRVYMNYSDTMHNFLVLAHELGHAYHDHVCFSLPELAQHYPMSVAETASTTCELIALDGLIKRSKQKKWLYYEKAHRSTTFFLNIHARYLFEQELFKTQYCDPQKLCEMMLDAQKEAYGNRLETYHPYFWITKQHFYLTDIPSYNFPYTFGYLLSQAINARMKKEPDWFTAHYNSFLQDTGRMSVEELVQKHFGQNLHQDQFWLDAIENAAQDVEEFLAL